MSAPKKLIYLKCANTRSRRFTYQEAHAYNLGFAVERKSGQIITVIRSLYHHTFRNCHSYTFMLLLYSRNATLDTCRNLQNRPRVFDSLALGQDSGVQLQ